MGDLLNLLIEPLRYPFMVRGLLASLMVGTLCAVVGTYVVLRGMAFFGDALAHTILPGIALGYLVSGGARDVLFWWALGTAIVAALATRKPLADASVEFVRQSRHWLVRLAGYATGLLSPDLTQDTVQDSNYWITELAGAAGVLDFWPGKATPADFDKLAAIPPEGWAGRAGAARKVLRTVLAHRNVSIFVEDFTVRPDEYSVVVEDAD